MSNYDGTPNPIRTVLARHPEPHLAILFGSMASGRPIDLNTVGEPLLGQIVKHGLRILGTDERYAELIRHYLFEVADFMPYYRRILEERGMAWIGKESSKSSNNYVSVSPA